MPAVYNLAVYRGDTSTWIFNLWQDMGQSNPVNLAGYTAKAELRNAPSGTTIVPTTCTITLPNTVTMTLAAANAKNAVSGTWDLQLTDSLGDVTTMLSGIVTVTLDTTDSS